MIADTLQTLRTEGRLALDTDKPAHMTLIQRIEVSTLKALKSYAWSRCHKTQTEHGEIRVPPAGAQRIQ